MKVLIATHDDGDQLGWIAGALSDARVTWEVWDGSLDAAADGYILLGGPASANAEHLAGEVAWIRRALDSGRPVLGVCLGAQLICRALAAPVYPNIQPEIGWAPVRFTGEARQDTLFQDVDNPAPVFHWHRDTFDLPDGAVRLAYSNHCRNQAFRWRDKVWGLQFHLEATPEIIDRWQREDRACARPELDAPVDSGAHQDVTGSVATTVFRRWVSLL